MFKPVNRQKQAVRFYVCSLQHPRLKLFLSCILPTRCEIWQRWMDFTFRLSESGSSALQASSDAEAAPTVDTKSFTISHKTLKIILLL